MPESNSSENNQKTKGFNNLENFKIAPQQYAAIYARKSTLMENNSIDAQISLAKDVIRDKGLALFDIYYDEETATKFNPMHRPGFKKLIYDAENNKFKNVIVFRRDRLARKVDHLLEIKNIFKKNHIDIIYSNPDELQPSDSYISNFIENIIMAVDELEPQILTERISIGKDKKRERGEYTHGRYVPYGYTVIYESEVSSGFDFTNKNKVKAYYKQVKNQAEVIADLFKQYINSTEFDEKCFYNKIKETSIIDTSKSKRKKKLDYNNESKVNPSISLQSKILNPVYAGLLLKDKTKKVEDSIFIDSRTKDFLIDKSMYRNCSNIKEPIINCDIWYKALMKWYSTHKFKRNTHEEEVDKIYLFKGILYCKCGRKIYLSNDTYKCKNNCVTMPEIEMLRTLFTKIIEDLKNDSSINENINKRNCEIKCEIDAFDKELLKNKIQITEELRKMILNKKTKSDKLSELLKTKRAIVDSIGTQKERTIETKYIIKQIEEISKGKSINFIIIKMKENCDISQDMLKGLIKKVVFRGKGQKPEIEYRQE